MAPPTALGYLRTDGGTYPEQSLSERQIRARKNAIQVRAEGYGLDLMGLYVEDVPGSRQMLSRLLATACFCVAHDDQLAAIIIFEPTDLGTTGLMQARTQDRIDDLDLRLEIISVDGPGSAGCAGSGAVPRSVLR